MVTVLVLLGLAAGAFALLRGHILGTHATAGSSSSVTGSAGSPGNSGNSGTATASGGTRTPAATVRAYVAAINNKDYRRAWNLGGRNTGGSYQSFVQGFSTTARDTATIVSVAGNVVTARISARQADGTIKTYQGTYTVEHGVITNFNITQTSG